MLVINLKLDGDNAWPELREKTLHEAEALHITALAGGMVSGRTSVTIRLDLPNDEVVIAQTSLRLFLLAADGLRARYGNKED